MSTETGGSVANLMLALQAAQGAGEAASSYQQASATRMQGRYDAGIQRRGAAFADLQAQDVLRRGEEAAQERLRQARSLIESQRAAASGQGVRVDAGTPLALQEDAAAAGAMDADTIRLNAFREAWGLRMEALDRRAAARNVRSGSRYASRQTIASGGIRLGQDLLQGGYLYGQLKPQAKPTPRVGPDGPWIAPGMEIR